jgi:hypothetical protein
MTNPDDMTDPNMMQPDPTGNPPDKLYAHNRQQLSAMLDGALSPDEARFMLRRLQHDTELASCWERWQVCGDVLRGQRNALLPADFAQRVSRAIATDGLTSAAATAAGKPRWARWGGGAALAASVAVAALFVARPGPNAIDPVPGDAATSGIVAASSPSPSAPPVAVLETPPVATRPAAPQPAAPQPVAPDTATQLAATAVAVAAVPRRAAERRSRGQSQRAAARTSPIRASEAPPVIVAAAGNVPAMSAPAGSNAHIDPFAAQVLVPASKPWPRAILPGYPAAGAFNVDYGSNASSSFYPFEPRVVGRAEAIADGQQGDDDAPAPPQP